jgi:dipeptidase E
MKLLLTSNGISNPTIERALVELLGKPIADANALFVATGMYPYPGGPGYAWNAIASKARQIGWKSVGNLELSVLPSIDKDVWQPTVAAADAIHVFGGDPVFLAYWMRASGLAEVIGPRTVYVGTSAGSMAASTTIGEMFTERRRARGEELTSEAVVLPDRDTARTFVMAHGMGWVDFALIPHYNAPEQHDDASLINAKVWAAKIAIPTYAIDDHTAVKISDGNVEVVSEGKWQLFPAASG